MDSAPSEPLFGPPSGARVRSPSRSNAGTSGCTNHIAYAGVDTKDAHSISMDVQQQWDRGNPMDSERWRDSIARQSVGRIRCSADGRPTSLARQNKGNPKYSVYAVVMGSSYYR